MRQSADAILDDWQRLGLPFVSRPEYLHEFRGGALNRNVLLAADGARWVLRIAPVGLDIPGLDRQREAHIVDAAAAAGLTPAITWRNIDNGLQISRFIDGKHLPAGALDDGRLRRLLALLAEVKALTVAEAPLNYQGLVQQYHATDTADETAAALEELDARTDKRLCHHDPNPGNVLESDGRFYLLDWEYAAPGNPLWDVAAVCEEWRVDARLVARLSASPANELEVARAAYRGIKRLWETALPAAANQAAQRV